MFFVLKSIRGVFTVFETPNAADDVMKPPKDLGPQPFNPGPLLAL